VRTQFVTDDNGKKLAIILPMNEYNKLIEELEDVEDVKRYDAVKARKEKSIPMAEAFKMIDELRKAK
jgi:hypothetical protein